jgi:hypothetical protein
MKDEALKQKLGMEQRNRGSVGFQEALAQPEPYDQTALEVCNVCGWKTLIPDDACLNCERAQPEQEPVATVTSETGADITMSWWHEPALPIGTKLYTTPPQRKPLTQDGTMEIANQTAGQYWMNEAHIQRFRAAVEAAHGIGGET